MPGRALIGNLVRPEREQSQQVAGACLICVIRRCLAMLRHSQRELPLMWRGQCRGIGRRGDINENRQRFPFIPAVHRQPIKEGASMRLAHSVGASTCWE
jgi:hypothetical protein